MTTAPDVTSAPQRAPGPRNLALSSSIISGFSLLSVAAGFALNALLAARFGIGPEVDAFFIANTLPYLIQGLARGSANTALVSGFSREAALGRAQDLRSALSFWLSTSLVLGGVLSLGGIAASSGLVRLLAPGAGAHVQELAGGLSQVLFLTVLMTGPVSVLRAFLYSRHVFAVPAALDAVQRIVAAVTFVFLVDRLGIAAAAFGYAIGTTAQLALVALSTARHVGVRYCYFDLRGASRHIRSVRQMLLSTASSFLGQGTVAVDRIVGSFLPQGSIATLGYARSLMEVATQVLLSSAPLALLPSLADSAARNAHNEVRKKLALLFNLMSGISTLFAAYLVLVSGPLVAALYQRGSFDAEAVQLTASTLAVYALGMLIVGHFRVVEFYLYAVARARQVLLLFAVFAALTFAFDVLLAGLWGVRGIALAYTVSLCLPLFLGVRLARQGLETSAWRRLGVWNLKMVAGCGSALLLAGLLQGALTTALRVNDLAGNLVVATVSSAAYALAFLASAWMLRMRELTGLLGPAVSKITGRRYVR